MPESPRWHNYVDALTALPFDRFFVVSAITSVSVVLATLATSLVLLVVPTTLLGATFSVALRVYTTNVGRVGSRTGHLYFSNTLGAILGSLFAALVMLPLLGAKVVCGGANNQLAEARHAAALAERGILFVPDYIANAGGVIDFHQERIGNDAPEVVLGAVARIHDITRDVLDRAARTGETPLRVADRMVLERIDAARRASADGADS